MTRKGRSKPKGTAPGRGRVVNDWLTIGSEPVNQAEGETRARIDIMAPIGGFFGVDSEEISRELARIDADVIEVHLNSGGGIAKDGVATCCASTGPESKPGWTVSPPPPPR